MNKVKRYNEFVAMGGTRSGVFDISDKETRKFVKKYRDFIPKKDVYRRNRKGQLVSISRKQRRKDRKWLKSHK